MIGLHFVGAPVPVTAKLSRQFYDRLGDDAANELVEWFNQVDATYRADLRDLNESNFLRFDAKVEQRFAEQDTRIDRRFAEQDVKFERRFAEMDAKFEKRFAEFDRRLSEMETKIERALKDQTRFFFLAWLTQMAAILALR